MQTATSALTDPNGMIMNLAAGYIAQAMQTHDELVAARVNQHRRSAAERRADRDEQAARAARPGLLHRIAALWHDGRTASTMRPAH
jgi:hypothetical protein